MIKVHEQTRSVLNHRIQHGTMTIKLLAALTGISVSHLCNFTHGVKVLGLYSLYKVMHALDLDCEAFPIDRA